MFPAARGRRRASFVRGLVLAGLDMEPATTPASPTGDRRAPLPRLTRSLELLLLFVAVPGSIGLLRAQGIAVPTIPALLVFAALALSVLLVDRRFDRREFARTTGLARELPRVALFFALGAGAMAAYVALVEPDVWLTLPRRHPWAWLVVLCIYPLASAYPQEVVWRAFFYHRYGALLGSQAARIAVNAALFGFMHIVFWNVLAVAVTAVGGVFFAWTYERTRSVLLVAIEHALYGCAAFTLGVGVHFLSAWPIEPAGAPASLGAPIDVDAPVDAGAAMVAGAG
jgi:membrane protease YdiL (CAAX protease family)